MPKEQDKHPQQDLCLDVRFDEEPQTMPTRKPPTSGETQASPEEVPIFGETLVGVNQLQEELPIAMENPNPTVTYRCTKGHVWTAPAIEGSGAMNMKIGDREVTGVCFHCLMDFADGMFGKVEEPS